MPFTLRHGSFAICLALAIAATAARADEVFELRIYTANEGKLDALHERFRNHTMALFEKHGMRNVAYWIDTDTPNTLVYVVAHKDRASAAKSWRAFVADPAWQAAYAASIANGQIVADIESRFMSATDYSPLR